MDGVEIDPDIVDAGRRFFDMNEPNLTVHVADGRPFLRTSGQTWDLIAVDAFRQPYIPFYLTTREFFVDVSGHLNDDGSVMINVGKTPGDSDVADAIAATMRDVFPSVYSFSVGQFNQLVVATKQPAAATDLAGRVAGMPPDVARLAGQVSSRVEEVQPGGAILTDDKAPVEWLTDQMIIHYATQE
ncbi:MAG: spermidine synthase [Thermoleophilia bacterium]